MHGLRQIVRFNWPFYAVATTARAGADERGIGVRHLQLNNTAHFVNVVA